MIPLADLDKSILQTIVYFDLFDYPLTDWEVFKFLISNREYSYPAVKHALNRQSKKLSSSEGFYCLPNRQEIIKTRKQRYLIADEKYKIALKNAKLLRKLPFVKAIFVANSLSYSNAKQESDIDLVIISKANRIWTTRFFCASLMKLLRRRPTSEKKENTICLSFYLDEDHLDLKPYALDSDLHFAYWLRQFTPIYDPENIHSKFQLANNWVNPFIANLFENNTTDRRMVLIKSLFQPLTQFIASLISETTFKNYQLKILPQVLKEKSQTPNAPVVLSDTILKLHSKDKRKEINDNWKAACKAHIPHFDLELTAKVIGKFIGS